MFRPTAGTRPDAVTVVAHEIGPFGGMEWQLAVLVTGMLERGLEVTSIGRRIELAPHPGLRVVELSGPRRPFPIAYLWFFVAGTAAVAKYRRGPVYTIGAIVLNRVTARKVPFCHTAFARSPDRASRASRDSRLFRVNAVISAAMSRFAERLVYRPRCTGQLVAMSTGDARELEELFPAIAPVAVIPNGVDTGRFRPDPVSRHEIRTRLGIAPDTLVAVFLGGDWARKGLPQTITALGRARRWTLLVVGSGDVAAMTALAGRELAGDRVIFAGRVDDPERFLAAADALAMPSSYEPWGNAMLEACACGLPVVVAPANGVRDFVVAGESGLFVAPDATSVAQALEQLEDEDLRLTMGRRAREIAAGYSFDHVVDQYVRLLTSTTGSSPTAVRPVAI
ncbi:MAG: glycosyltransferase family 4 protein [Solirubrobacterales bacterium]